MLERRQWGVEVTLGHLLSRIGEESQRLGNAADALGDKEEDDQATDKHAEYDE